MANALCYIVDDDPAICRLLSSVAAASGIQAEAFPSVKRLVAGIAKRMPSLVFLDIALEGSDAIDAIRLLARNKFQGSVQLISGADGDMLTDITEVGTQYSLRMLPPQSKPLDPGAVQSVFRQLDGGTADDTADHTLLDEALQHSWVDFWFQPKIDLHKRVMAGAELLARVNHPDRGVIGPDKFLPRAERRSIARLTEHALQIALRASVDFAAAGFQPRLSINTPVSALMTLPIAAIVRDYHHDRDGWPGLILEVAEDEVLKDMAAAVEIALQLKLCGVGLSIDDFGNGYSTMARMKSLPVCEVKINPTFTANCAADPHNGTLCRTIIDLAHGFQCVACAEGIETTDQLRFLHRHGCDHGQGFLLAGPMPKKQLLGAMLERRNRHREALRVAHARQ